MKFRKKVVIGVGIFYGNFFTVCMGYPSCKICVVYVATWVILNLTFTKSGKQLGGYW